jgi:cation transport ATPase
MVAALSAAARLGIWSRNFSLLEIAVPKITQRLFLTKTGTLTTGQLLCDQTRTRKGG